LLDEPYHPFVNFRLLRSSGCKEVCFQKHIHELFTSEENFKKILILLGVPEKVIFIFLFLFIPLALLFVTDRAIISTQSGLTKSGQNTLNVLAEMSTLQLDSP